VAHEVDFEVLEELGRDFERRPDHHFWHVLQAEDSGDVSQVPYWLTHDHQLLDSAPNLGPLISRWENNKFESCRYESVGNLEVLKLSFQQFLNLSRSQRNMSGPILKDLSNKRWSWSTM
jgi:hypothetical protein